jgi:16S rRNA (adenine1518-N6/adenine1519-N6)-dimethyltransferase
VDPNLARAIAAAAELGPGDRVVEIGAGFGSLTVALAATGARVLAIEFDRALVPPLRDVVAAVDGVEVLEADALHLDWPGTLPGSSWTVCANLPYNVAVPIVLALLDEVPAVRRLVVMVQREVAARFLAGPGEPHYGPVGLRVARVARTELLRRVPPGVFWPRPSVSSAVVRIDRLDRPAVATDEARLWAVVDAAFAERRKTIRAALVRLGVDTARSAELLKECRIDPRARAERLSLQDFARLAGALP